MRSSEARSGFRDAGLWMGSRWSEEGFISRVQIKIMRRADTSTRLAVTGLGIICAIGRDQSEVWQSIVESRVGIGKLTKFPGETFPTDIAAEVEGDLGDVLTIGGREAK